MASERFKDSEGLAARLSEVAKDNSITRSELVRRACELYLACNILEEFGAKVVSIEYKGEMDSVIRDDIIGDSGDINEVILEEEMGDDIVEG